MATCKTCRFFKLINSKTGSGKCGAEPKPVETNITRSSCRFFENKENFLPESDDSEILYEERR